RIGGETISRSARRVPEKRRRRGSALLGGSVEVQRNRRRRRAERDSDGVSIAVQRERVGEEVVDLGGVTEWPPRLTRPSATLPRVRGDVQTLPFSPRAGSKVREARMRGRRDRVAVTRHPTFGHPLPLVRGEVQTLPFSP